MKRCGHIKRKNHGQAASILNFLLKVWGWVAWIQRQKRFQMRVVLQKFIWSRFVYLSFPAVMIPDYNQMMMIMIRWLWFNQSLGSCFRSVPNISKHDWFKFVTLCRKRENTQPASDSFVDFYFYDWHDHPFIRGGYTSPVVGSHAMSIELAKAVEKKLFFAGEASNVTATSTVQAAVDSGNRAASEILEFINSIWSWKVRVSFHIPRIYSQEIFVIPLPQTSQRIRKSICNFLRTWSFCSWLSLFNII